MKNITDILYIIKCIRVTNFRIFVNLFFTIFLYIFSYSQTKKDVVLNFKIDKFNFEKNITETTFEITNKTDQNLIANNWELHWNQMKGSIIRNSLPDGITYKYINGQSYYKMFFGKNWKLNIGETISFNVNFHGIIDREIMGPIGVFIVNNKIAFDIKLNTIWKNAEGLDLLEIPSSEDLYDTYPDRINNDSKKISVVPTPNSIVYREGNQLLIDSWNLKIDPFFMDKSNLIKNMLTNFFVKKIRNDESDDFNLKVIRKKV